MRIALVSHEYPPQPNLGGVGAYMFRLARALGAAGHSVHVLAGPSSAAEIPLANVTVHRIPAEFNPRRFRFAYWHFVAEPLARADPMIWHWLRWNLATAEALRRIDRSHPFDLIEAPEHAANGLIPGLLHRWPLLLRAHCPWELFVRINRLPMNPANRLLAWLERHTLAAYPDAITAPSHAMKRILENWPLRRPVRVIPNFMDIPPTPMPLPDTERILCTGRLEPLKGQDRLALAFALIARAHPRAELWLVGSDRWPGRHRFADLLPRLVPDDSIRRRIHTPGLLPLAEINTLLRTARIAVVASVAFESFSYSALEAMAAARPLLVTPAGALPELVTHEQTGLITQPDPPALAQALDRLLCDHPLAEHCARNAHATALQRYDTPVVLPQILRSYAQAISAFSPFPRASHRRHLCNPAIEAGERAGVRGSHGLLTTDY